jgi:hypothetical protein
MPELTAEQYDLLVRAAPLDRLSGPLCDAALGMTDSAAVLDQLDRLSLFVVALERRREWYRCHHLFREALLRRRPSAPGAKPQRHARSQVSSPLQASSRSGHEALAQPGQETPSRRHLPPPRPPNRTLVGSRGRRIWDGSGVWPVRPRLTSNVITPRSSANLVRPPILVVLDLPVMAADYAEQISHGSPTSASVWMALTLHGSGRPVSECAGVPASTTPKYSVQEKAVVTALARLTIGTCRPSCRAPGDQHSNGPTSHRLDANSREPFVAIVSTDQAAAWLRLPSQAPPYG